MSPITMDYTAAEAAWRAGLDPQRADPPMHGSFEDQAGVPDTFLARLSPAQQARQVSAWRRLFSQEQEEEAPDIVHLNHLTPMHQTAFDVWKDAAIVTHLHGTELKMIQTVHDTPGLRYGVQWIEQMRSDADRSRLILTISPHDRDLAIDLLAVPPDRVITIPNGVDVDIFRPREIGGDERLSNWTRWLVTDPQGWKPGGSPGGLRYSDEDLRMFRDVDGMRTPILMYVGRFTAFKRVDVLLDAYEMLKATTIRKIPLVIWGGFPGEWEGEHPYEAVRRRGIDGVFFAGWRGHDELPLALASSDIFVAPSVNEPFGQVYLEAMSCGLPVIATRTGGPLSFVNVDPNRQNGWLVEPGDPHSLMVAMAEAIESKALREERGSNAREHVTREYSWDKISDVVSQAYEDAMGVG
jgi:glycosyltransferase involved in cell wall biosynthesis